MEQDVNPKLPTRRLGTTGMDITTVGFGAWAVGGPWAFGWGEQDDATSIAAIRHALDRGVNWIDTAAVYGLGHSEEVVREALRGLAADARPYVFTKCGRVVDERDRTQPPQTILRRDSIRREAEASLRRLGVERIDLYQVHWPPADGTQAEEYWGTMLELKAEGKVRAIGVSNHNVAELEAAERLGHVETMQPPFSAIRRAFAERELPWCRQHDCGVIVYAPMQSGLLTGAFSAERAASLPPGDWRARSPEHTGEGLKRNLVVAEAMKRIGERRGVAAGAVAVAWTLAWPGVTGAIVGARSPEQVDGWVDAARLRLSEEELDEIAEGIETSGAGSGPTRPPR